MQHFLKLGTLLALSAFTLAHAQGLDAAAQASATPFNQAPIVRDYTGAPRARGLQSFDSEPAAGVFVRSDMNNGVQALSSTGPITEIRVASGRANITVHHPADKSRILVDLPGGQVSLLKDGLYTFNAQTNTVRVLHGEAEARDGGTGDGTKGIKVKETQQLAFFPGAKPRAVNAYAYELTADLMPGANRGDGVRRAAYYGDGPYYAGAYGDPYAYGFYPYGFAPYGYGYPLGFGLGFGYRGGFGGFRGGGFHGGSFRR